jgi:hypothetical protein
VEEFFHHTIERIVTLATYFGSIVSGDPAEGFVAVDNGVVDDLSICQQETAVGWRT